MICIPTFIACKQLLQELTAEWIYRQPNSAPIHIVGKRSFGLALTSPLMLLLWALVGMGLSWKASVSDKEQCMQMHMTALLAQYIWLHEQVGNGYIILVGWAIDHLMKTTAFD